MSAAKFMLISNRSQILTAERRQVSFHKRPLARRVRVAVLLAELRARHRFHHLPARRAGLGDEKTHRERGDAGLNLWIILDELHGRTFR